MFFIATLRTGPFFIPNFNQAPPINTLIVLLSNQTNQTLTASVSIDQVYFAPGPIYPPSPITVLLPATSFTLPPNTATGLNQPLISDTINTNQSSNDSRALLVTIMGDVEKSGNKIQVSVTGGFSMDGSSLDISEKTMFFRHDDFVHVHTRQPRNFHPLMETTPDVEKDGSTS